MRKNKTVLKILILALVFLFTAFISTSEAAFWSDVFDKGDEFLNLGASNADSVRDNDTKKIINEIYSILFPLGIVITVIVGGVLGIKFMAASAEDKAKVKESMIPYVVGCMVIYGAFGIWRICIQIFSQIN